MKWAKVTWEGDKITQNVLGMKWVKKVCVGKNLILFWDNNYCDF